MNTKYCKQLMQKNNIMDLKSIKMTDHITGGVKIESLF